MRYGEQLGWFCTKTTFCHVFVVVCFCLMGVYVAVLVSLGPLLFWYAAYYLHSLWQNVLLNKMCKSWMVVIRAEVSDRGWAYWKRHPSFSLLCSYSGWSTIHVKYIYFISKDDTKTWFPHRYLSLTLSHSYSSSL